MIASLPMYQRPELEAPLERFWQAIQDNIKSEGLDAPNALTQSICGVQDWIHPHLVLSQTCGAPFRDHLAGRVQLVGTPDARLFGCDAGYYQSVFIARDLITWADAISGTWAANEAGSQSGYFAALQSAPSRLPDPIWSGSHLASISMVASGKANWAAIDAVTWQIACQLENTHGLTVWHRSVPTPALPYITALRFDAVLVSQGLRRAIKEVSQEDRDLLCVHDLIDIPEAQYLSIPKP